MGCCDSKRDKLEKLNLDPSPDKSVDTSSEEAESDVNDSEEESDLSTSKQ